MSSEACLKYWSENLKVDQSKFILRYNDGGISGKAKYGICRITLKKGSRILKLMHSLIRLSFSDIMGFKILWHNGLIIVVERVKCMFE